ncbi:hypothetical protein [Streptomyces liangshanensis]|uniref:Uncharacterized protein n=1 Tax=Streptomyces liangshanensis TaxID=2717324 RepID=A0A6G9GS38_9ACTN|nr:hypothetical protein [Streptomyces liangshanensis]QIQ00889.1 hypothetical protein HA039_16120 [Streptomyces liangshanensis]
MASRAAAPRVTAVAAAAAKAMGLRVDMGRDLLGAMVAVMVVEWAWGLVSGGVGRGVLVGAGGVVGVFGGGRL